MTKLCPLLKEPCLEHKCAWYIYLLGQHPQKDVTIDEWGCAITWLPILQIETSKETRQAAAAIESARNDARKDTAAIGAALVNVAEVATRGAVVIEQEVRRLGQ